MLSVSRGQSKMVGMCTGFTNVYNVSTLWYQQIWRWFLHYFHGIKLYTKSVCICTSWGSNGIVILSVKLIVILNVAKGYSHNFKQPYLDAHVSSLLYQSQSLILYSIAIWQLLIDVYMLKIFSDWCQQDGVSWFTWPAILMQNLNQDYEDSSAFRKQLIIFGRLGCNVNLIFIRIKAGQNTSIRTDA